MPRTLENTGRPNEWLLSKSLEMYTRLVRGYEGNTDEFYPGTASVTVALGAEAIGRFNEDWLATEEAMDNILKNPVARQKTFDVYANAEPLVLKESENPFLELLPITGPQEVAGEQDDQT